ncbi:M23 family metallopeptidase [Streptomyces niger]|uniref:M23 family metallopeptidase n=1 Tax=Streptomyces niger TaxID=66373 RepID=UPI000B21B47E
MASNKPAPDPSRRTAYEPFATHEGVVHDSYAHPHAHPYPHPQYSQHLHPQSGHELSHELSHESAHESAHESGHEDPGAHTGPAFADTATFPAASDTATFSTVSDTAAFPTVDAVDGVHDGAWEEWNPTEESVRPVRGRHRVAKQRGGGLARSSTVLGVGVMAAVGAGGIATAQGKPQVSISMPDLGGVAERVSEKLPAAESLPGIGELVSHDSADATDTQGGPFTQAAGIAGSEHSQGGGEALRARILEQAEQAQNSADQEAREAAEQAAVEQAEAAAAERRQDAEAAKEKADAEAKAKAEEAERKKAEAARAAKLAELAKSYTLPVSSFTITATFGQAGDRWAADHTGLDFAAPTGTPAKAVHSGTITQAGWAGSYGYRIVVTLDDGTELWYCHLSSMVKTSGKVNTGDVIGRVGATGNVTGPHLHLEVRPSADSPIDPMPWLRDHGLNV